MGWGGGSRTGPVIRRQYTRLLSISFPRKLIAVDLVFFAGSGISRSVRRDASFFLFSSLFALTRSLSCPCFTSADYIFLLPPSPSSSKPAPRITAYLRPHRTEDISPGLPMKGVSASDHVAVCGEIKF